MKRTPTSDLLADALDAEGAPREMVDAARSGHYDDFRSELAFPLTQLVHDATRFGMDGIVKRALDGEFDAQDWEAEAWRASPEGRATFHELFGRQAAPG